MPEPAIPPASDPRPLLVALHFLGSDATQWEPVFARLREQFRCLAIDLPGFGAAVGTPGYDVASMAAHVADAVRRHAPQRWLMVGHSMGAKVACAVARLAENGGDGLQGLTHLVLVAGSPPRPEPMKDSKRKTMRAWFAGPDAERRKQADGYIRDNVAEPLPDAFHAGLVEAVLAANRNAWVAWLDGGSREDWAERIGTLQTPALILAGEKDAALGKSAQTEAMMPHFVSVRLHVVPKTGHLLPTEQPDTVAACIVAFAGRSSFPEPGIPPGYRTLLASPRVDERTRAILLDRAKPVPANGTILSADEFTILQSVVDRVIPQGGKHRIDIAARMVHLAADLPGDGWRFAELPPDVEALRGGLRNLDLIAQTLDAAGFAFLPAGHQDALLAAMAEARLTSPLLRDGGGLTAEQLQLWFEDVRSFATQIYVAHPATAARIGFSGIANRGDGAGPQGFQAVGPGQREPWEPVAQEHDR